MVQQDVITRTVLDVLVFWDLCGRGGCAFIF